ncbi:MAG: hypothetical protein N2319_03930 [Candidatus Kapabacteria bacterium]|nr:hypothetical protein [Candidatus Kapabacteria bacterium]
MFDFYSVETIKKKQLQKFRNLFNYAKVHSKFYHNLYKEAGVYDLEINDYEDIKKIPIINKADLRKATSEKILTLKQDDPSLNIRFTSGSTGEPFKIYMKKIEEYTGHIRLTYTYFKRGYNPFKKIALLSRYEPSHKFEIEKDLSILTKLQKTFGLFRRYNLSIYDPLDKIIEQVQDIKPFLLVSTPGILTMLANKLNELNLNLNIPLVLLTSETVSDNQVKLFKNTVGRKFIDVYGCMECPSIAYEFDYNGKKKIFLNSSLMEITEQQKDQKILYKPIITNLIHYAMPVIRYDVGDYLEEPIIQDKMPITEIGRILGRIDDTIELSNGKFLAHHHAHEMFINFIECEQWKFIKKRDENIKLQLKISKENEVNKEEIRDKALYIWKKRYPDQDLLIEFVDFFEVDKISGKFKNIENIK